MTKKEIGEALSRKADEKQMSGYAIAKATGIDTGTINRILSGSREPGAINLLRICKFLKMEVKDFVD